MNISQLNDKIFEIEQSLEEIENKAVADRVIEMTLKPLKKQLKIKALKRQHLAKTLSISDETDKLLMEI